MFRLLGDKIVEEPGRFDQSGPGPMQQLGVIPTPGQQPRAYSQRRRLIDLSFASKTGATSPGLPTNWRPGE